MIEPVTAAIVVLAHRGIPPDVQELLVHGNPSRGIPPGALQAVLSAYNPNERLTARVAELEAALRASDSCLKDLQATVVGECPTLLDEDSGGCSRLDMAIDDALLQTALALGKCPSCRSSRKHVPGFCKDPLQHIPQPTWTEAARAEFAALSPLPQGDD